MQAVESDDETLVRMLVQAGAHVNQIESEQSFFAAGQDALYYYLGRTSCGVYVDPIVYHTSIVQALLSAGEDPNQKQDRCEETIVMRAVKLKNDDTINFFLSKASKIDWCQVNRGNRTVLDLAKVYAPQYVNRLTAVGARTNSDCGGKKDIDPEADPIGFFCR